MGFYTSCFGCPFLDNVTINTSAAVSTAALPSAENKKQNVLLFPTCLKKYNAVQMERLEGWLRRQKVPNEAALGLVSA